MNYRRWRDFKKGVVSTDAIGIGKEASGTLRAAQNVRCRSGSIVSRGGRVLYCDFSGGALAGETLDTINEFAREAFSGASYVIWRAILFTANSRLYYVVPEDSTTVFIEIDNTFTLTSDDIYGVNVFDHFIFGNGRDALKMTDGIGVYNVGIPAPTNDPTSAGIVGNISGYKTYKYTFYKSGTPYARESNEGDEVVHTFAVAPATSGARITMNAVDADAEVTRFRLYATESYASLAAPKTDFYLISEQVIGTTTFDDVNETSTTTPYDTTDRGVPPAGHKPLWHDNRLFLIGDEDNPSIVVYSEIGKPWYFPTNNWDEVGRDDGDVLTALGSIGPTRYLFKSQAVYEWTGDPESVTPIRAAERPDATMNMNRVSVGCNDPRSLAGYKDSLVFRAHDGHVYKITATSFTQLSEYYHDILDMASNSKAAVHNDYYIISSGGETHVCNLRSGAWQAADTGLSPNAFLIDHNGYILGAEGDQIKRYYTAATQDEGEDFTKFFEPAFKEVSDGAGAGIIRRWLLETSARDCDITLATKNESSQIDSGTYSNGDRHYSLPSSTRGNVADYVTGRFTWTGSMDVEGIRMFFKHRGRRH